jgi:hypothetical protein
MATVQDLIKMLQTEYDPTQAIVFQYFTAEHAKMEEEEFVEVADYLMDNESFGEETSEMFSGWITEAQDVLATEEDDEDEEE